MTTSQTTDTMSKPGGNTNRWAFCGPCCVIQVEEMKSWGDVNELPRYLKKAHALDNKLHAAAEKIDGFVMLDVHI